MHTTGWAKDNGRRSPESGTQDSTLPAVLQDTAAPPPQSISPSLSLLKKLMPGEYQSFETRKERLGAYYETLQNLAKDTLSPSRGGRQIGSEVYLGGLPRATPVITVGDIHGEIQNLSRILLHDDNLFKISQGEAVLLLMGDLIHPERNDLADMRTSLQTHELFMNLKIAYPHHVFSLVGNHDPIFESATKGIRVGESRLDVQQSEVYQHHLRKALLTGGADDEECENYLQTLAFCTEMSPLYCVGRLFAAAHAGPITELDRKTLRNQHPIDDEISFTELRLEFSKKPPGTFDPDLKRAYIQGCWGRFRPGTASHIDRHKPLYEYDEEDIRAFLATLNLPTGSTLIVGHTPPRDRSAWAEEIALSLHSTDNGEPPRFIRITASRDTVGYIKTTGSGIELVDL